MEGVSRCYPSSRLVEQTSEVFSKHSGPDENKCPGRSALQSNQTGMDKPTITVYRKTQQASLTVALRFWSPKSETKPSRQFARLFPDNPIPLALPNLTIRHGLHRLTSTCRIWVCLPQPLLPQIRRPDKHFITQHQLVGSGGGREGVRGQGRIFCPG